MSTLLLLCGLLILPTANAQDASPCDDHSCSYSINLEKAGFYVAAVTLPTGQKEGIWSLVIEPPIVHRGDFHGGGVLADIPGLSSWVGFSLAQPDTVQIYPFNYPNDPIPFNLELFKDQGNQATRSIWGPTLVTPGQNYTTPLLDAGFYIALANSTAGKDFFGLSLLSPNLFGGVSGGWLDSVTGVGFAAFDIPVPRKVTFKLLFGSSYGELGSEQPHLEVYYQDKDGTRTLYWSAPKSTSTDTPVVDDQTPDDETTEDSQTLPNLVHPQKGNAVLLSADAKQTWNIPTKFSGGVSVDAGDFVASGLATHFQQVSIKAKIEVQPEHVGQNADLLFMVGMATPPAPYGEGEDTIYSSVSSSNDFYPLGLQIPADQQQPVSMSVPVVGWEPDRISAFAHSVTLQSSTSMELRLDTLTEPGMYYFFPAYRLDSGDIVYSPMPIKLEVSAGEQPYFPGIVQIVATDVDKASLAWLPATDNKTPAEAIKYEVHLSDQPNFEPTSKTVHSSVTGASQIDLSGLTAATSYNLLVVAVDADGNRSKERDYRIARTFTKPAVVSTTTKFAEDKKLGLGSATTQDGVVFTYSAATPGVQPEVGSVLFINVEDGMYLRRVDSVENTAQGLVVRTSDGELADVFETGTIDSQVTLFDVQEAALRSGARSGVRTTRSLRADGSDYYEMRWQNPMFIANQTNYTNDDSDVEIARGMQSGQYSVRVKDGTRAAKESVEVRASVEFEPSIEAKVHIEGNAIKEAKVIARGELRAEVGASYKFEASGSVEKEVKLFTKSFVLRYLVGSVPIYQRNTFSLKAVLSAEASTEINAEAVANAMAGIEIGVQFNPETNVWEPIPPTPDFEKFATVNFNLHGKVTGKIRLIPNLQVEFYRVLATDISIEPFSTCSIAAETVGYADILEDLGYLKTQPTQFDVHLQVQAFIGASFGIFSKKISFFRKTLIWESPEWLLFSLPKLSADGGSGKVGESITLSATTEDGKNNPFDNGSIKWDVVPKEGSASGSKTGTFIASKEGVYDVFFSGHSRLPDRQFAHATVSVSDEEPKKPEPEVSPQQDEEYCYGFAEFCEASNGVKGIYKNSCSCNISDIGHPALCEHGENPCGVYHHDDCWAGGHMCLDIGKEWPR